MWIKSSLYKSILHLIGINGITYLFMLLSSIIIFRTVDKSYYGLYVIMVSLFALIELLMAGLNDGIVRFLKDKISLEDKKGIVLFVLYVKYSLILFFIFLIYLAKQYSFFEFLINDYQNVSPVFNSFIAIVVLNGIFGHFISVNNSILNSQLAYKVTARIDFIRNLFSLILVCLLSLITSNYLHYLYTFTLLSFITLLFLINKINKDFSEFSFFKVIQAKNILRIGQKNILPYSLPLTGSSLLTYAKNHLPLLILGKEFSLENVAIFSILKTFFKGMHAVSGSFVSPMMSEFLELKNDIYEFTSKLNRVFFGVLILRATLFCILLALINYFFLIFKLDDSSVNRYVVYLLGMEFIVAGMISIYGINLRLEHNTIKVLIASIARFIVEIILIYLILTSYGIMAAALILFIARSIETVFTFLFTYLDGLFRLHLPIVLFIFPIIYFFTLKLIE